MAKRRKVESKRESNEQTRAKYQATAADCPDCRKRSAGHRGQQRFCRRHQVPNLPGAA